MERLVKVGKITPKSSKDIKFSKIGIGFEKLDRDVFDPEKAYDALSKIGVKKARLQSGWQRTEKQKGVYDFEWLDKVVDKIISIGIEPWLCLCYGNELYTEAAKTVFGAVGVPPIHSEEEKQAWANYVEATVDHFKGRIHYYEVWNEPDGQWCWKHGPNPIEVADFNKATAIACKEADPSCEVIGLTLCHNASFAVEFAKTGALDYLDGISYHAYNVDEGYWKSRADFFFDMRDEYKRPKLKIFQGESGTQSRSDGAGALRGGAWTPQKQMKFLLRHLITDLACGVELASYFSCMDMIEALNGTVGNVSSYLDYGYFGVLGADFDSEGRSVGTYTPKPSYYALQTLCSVLSEEYDRCAIPAESLVLESIRMQGNDFDFEKASRYSFKRKDGSTALIYWVPKNILTECYEGTVSLRLDDSVKDKEIHLVDLANGDVFDLSEAMLEDGGILKNIPITDVPLMLIFGDFCDWKRV